jgi:acetyl esterase/lipase
MYHLEGLPPVYLLHGVDDELSPFSQSVELAEELGRRGMPYEFYAYEGLAHYSTSADNATTQQMFQDSPDDLTAVQLHDRMYGRRCVMERTKLTVRVSRDLLEGAKRYASEHDTTLTRLVSEFLRQLSIQGDPLDDAPAVRRLSGILSPDDTRLAGPARRRPRRLRAPALPG